MSDIVLKWVGAPVWEGRPGWPAKDLTQEELDRRKLDKHEMAAYMPNLYELVEPVEAEPVEAEAVEAESVEAEPVKPMRKRAKRVKKATIDTTSAEPD